MVFIFIEILRVCKRQYYTNQLCRPINDDCICSPRVQRNHIEFIDCYNRSYTREDGVPTKSGVGGLFFFFPKITDGSPICHTYFFLGFCTIWRILVEKNNRFVKEK